MPNTRLLLAVLILFTGPFAFAQNKQFTGKVFNAQKSPLGGVTVTIKNSKTSTATSNDGTFTLSTPIDKAVLVCIETTDVWQIGFLTQEDVHEFGLKDYVAVYVPQSYAFTGRLYFVKSERVRLLTDISSSEAMKFAISGGVTTIEEDTHTPHPPKGGVNASPTA